MVYYYLNGDGEVVRSGTKPDYITQYVAATNPVDISDYNAWFNDPNRHYLLVSKILGEELIDYVEGSDEEDEGESEEEGEEDDVPMENDDAAYEQKQQMADKDFIAPEKEEEEPFYNNFFFMDDNEESGVGATQDIPVIIRVNPVQAKYYNDLFDSSLDEDHKRLKLIMHYLKERIDPSTIKLRLDEPPDYEKYIHLYYDNPDESSTTSTDICTRFILVDDIHAREFIPTAYIARYHGEPPIIHTPSTDPELQEWNDDYKTGDQRKLIAALQRVKDGLDGVDAEAENDHVSEANPAWDRLADNRIVGEMAEAAALPRGQWLFYDGRVLSADDRMYKTIAKNTLSHQRPYYRDRFNRERIDEKDDPDIVRNTYFAVYCQSILDSPAEKLPLRTIASDNALTERKCVVYNYLRWVGIDTILQEAHSLINKGVRGCINNFHPERMLQIERAACHIRPWMKQMPKWLNDVERLCKYVYNRDKYTGDTNDIRLKGRLFLVRRAPIQQIDHQYAVAVKADMRVGDHLLYTEMKENDMRLYSVVGIETPKQVFIVAPYPIQHSLRAADVWTLRIYADRYITVDAGPTELMAYGTENDALMPSSNPVALIRGDKAEHWIRRYSDDDIRGRMKALYNQMKANELEAMWIIWHGTNDIAERKLPFYDIDSSLHDRYMKIADWSAGGLQKWLVEYTDTIAIQAAVYRDHIVGSWNAITQITNENEKRWTMVHYFAAEVDIPMCYRFLFMQWCSFEYTDMNVLDLLAKAKDLATRIDVQVLDDFGNESTHNEYPLQTISKIDPDRHIPLVAVFVNPLRNAKIEFYGKRYGELYKAWKTLRSIRQREEGDVSESDEEEEEDEDSDEDEAEDNDEELKEFSQQVEMSTRYIPEEELIPNQQRFKPLLDAVMKKAGPDAVDMLIPLIDKFVAWDQTLVEKARLGIGMKKLYDYLKTIKQQRGGREENKETVPEDVILSEYFLGSLNRFLSTQREANGLSLLTKQQQDEADYMADDVADYELIPAPAEYAVTDDDVVEEQRIDKGVDKLEENELFTNDQTKQRTLYTTTIPMFFRSSNLTLPENTPELKADEDMLSNTTRGLTTKDYTRMMNIAINYIAGMRWSKRRLAVCQSESRIVLEGKEIERGYESTGVGDAHTLWNDAVSQKIIRFDVPLIHNIYIVYQLVEQAEVQFTKEIKAWLGLMKTSAHVRVQQRAKIVAAGIDGIITYLNTTKQSIADLIAFIDSSARIGFAVQTQWYYKTKERLQIQPWIDDSVARTAIALSNPNTAVTIKPPLPVPTPIAKPWPQHVASPNYFQSFVQYHSLIVPLKFKYGFIKADYFEQTTEKWTAIKEIWGDFSPEVLRVQQRRIVAALYSELENPEIGSVSSVPETPVDLWSFPLLNPTVIDSPAYKALKVYISTLRTLYDEMPKTDDNLAIFTGYSEKKLDPQTLPIATPQLEQQLRLTLRNKARHEKRKAGDDDVQEIIEQRRHIPKKVKIGARYRGQLVYYSWPLELYRQHPTPRLRRAILHGDKHMMCLCLMNFTRDGSVRNLMKYPLQVRWSRYPPIRRFVPRSPDVRRWLQSIPAKFTYLHSAVRDLDNGPLHVVGIL